MFPSVLWAVGAVAVMVAMYWFGYRMEPHWVSKDGTRFLTTGQFIEPLGQVTSRTFEVRGTIMDNGQLIVSRRRMLRGDPHAYRVTAKSPEPPKGKAVYLLERVPKAGDAVTLMLRMPASSKAVERIDAARAAAEAARGVAEPPAD